MCPLRTLVSRFQRLFFLENVCLNCKMSKMHVNHSRVAVDSEKFYSVASPRIKQQNYLKTSAVNTALNSKRYRTSSISN